MVDGVFFTGWNSSQKRYAHIIKRIFEFTKHFPVLAICLGFEYLVKIISKKLLCARVLRMPKPYYSYKRPPVIGILTHPLRGSRSRSYIYASYVRFVESAGGRVIPLVYNESIQNLKANLNLVDGVIFTGGNSSQKRYAQLIKAIFEYAIEKNNKGGHFPVLAICLGFEYVVKIISKNNEILERLDALNHPSSLRFMDGIDIKKTLFGRFSTMLIDKLRTKLIAMHTHRFGVSLRRFQADKELSDFFHIITTSTDRKRTVTDSQGKVTNQKETEYVSTIQAKRYPITCVQWHPEKNAHVRGSSVIPQSADAKQVTYSFAEFFIREARKSSNRPPAEEVEANLIRNSEHTLTDCGNGVKGYDQVYMFPR